MLLTIQPDLVRKDMRHEIRLFLYGITIDIPLDELRDGGPERASNASYPWESVLVMPLGVTCPPASIPIHGGHPLGESLPRPYLDSFPQGLGLFGRLRKGGGVDSLSRPEPLRAVGLDEGHGRKALPGGFAPPQTADTGLAAPHAD